MVMGKIAHLIKVIILALIKFFSGGNEKTKSEREIIDSTRRKKRKRKSKFAQLMEEKKPVFDPKTHETYEKYLEEYYKLVMAAFFMLHNCTGNVVHVLHILISVDLAGS